MTQPGEQISQRSVPERDLGREISEHIDHTLERRTAPPGTLRAEAEDEAKRGGARLWHGLKKRPSLGVLVFGGLAIAAADAVGVGELALGLAIGYAAWKVLRKGEPVEQALEEAERLERV